MSAKGQHVIAARIASRGEKMGREYWRIRTRGASRKTLWCGWASEAEVAVHVTKLDRGVPVVQVHPYEAMKDWHMAAEAASRIWATAFDFGEGLGASVKLPLPGRVYLLGSGTGCVRKIGYSKSLDERVDHLDVGSASHLYVIYSVPGSIRVERAFQKYFEPARRKGEWFYDPWFALLAAFQGYEVAISDSERTT